MAAGRRARCRADSRPDRVRTIRGKGRYIRERTAYVPLGGRRWRSGRGADGGDAVGGGTFWPGQTGTRAFKEDTGVEPIYRIAAQKVDIGTADETKALVPDPAQAKGLVPAVAAVNYTHLRGATVREYPRVGDYAEVYADGRRGAKVVGDAGQPKGCADPDEIKDWKNGQSYLLCTTFLIPARARSVEVMWTEIGGEPFTWAF